MFSFQACVNVPQRSLYHGVGGLVEVEGRVVWSGGNDVFEFVNLKWHRVADSGKGATLAVCGGRLIALGGYGDDVYSKKVMKLRGGRWSLMSEMLIGCTGPCVLSVSGGGVVVMGGRGDGGRLLNDVQVFEGKTQTWYRGPSLPQPCGAMSAVVHGDLVFMMGGDGMGRVVWSANIRDLVSH